MSEQNDATRQPESAPRKPWIAPAITDLPRLENLTLQTGGAGGIDGGGGSVFP